MFLGQFLSDEGPSLKTLDLSYEYIYILAAHQNFHQKIIDDL